MKQKIITTICIGALFFYQSKAQNNNITIDASKAKDTINKNIYGHFAEHLGNCIYRGFYIGENKKYATFINSYNNTEGLFRIAVGPGTEDYNWTEKLMKEIPLKMLDGVSVHHYSVINWNKKGSATQFSEEEYFKSLSEAWRMEKFVTKNCEIMDKYDPTKKVALIVDEWGGWYETEHATNSAFLYQQNTMRDAMIAGPTLNIFNNYADRVRMANLAQCINVLQAVILTKDKKMVLTPTYHVMKMYNVHQDALMLPTNVISNEYVLGDQKIQAISASASKNETCTIHNSITNIDAKKEQEITIDLGNVLASSISGTILQSDKLQGYNSFENPNKIQPTIFKNATQNGNKPTVTIPAFSVVVLTLK